jgi:hypothetical protein
MWMNVSEWRGLVAAQSALLDIAAAIAGTTSPASAPSITTTTVNDLLIFGVAQGSSGTFGAPTAGGTPGSWTAMTAITTPTAQSSWYQNVSPTGAYNPSVSVTTAWDAAIAAFKTCFVSNASYVVANAQSSRVTVYWDSPNWVLVLQKAGSTITDVPTDGTNYTAGQTLGTSTVAYVGAAGSVTLTNATTPAVTNGTTYYYKVFTQCVGTYSSGSSVVNVKPQSTTSLVWSYGTTASAQLAPPALDDNDVVIWGGNDNKIHGANAADGTLEFAPFTGPTNAIQSRPAVVPAGWSVIPNTSVAYVTSQDGYVYAIDTNTGASVWPNGKSAVPGSSLLQGGAAVWLKSVPNGDLSGVGGICGANTDVVFVATHDTTNRATNKVYALNGGNTTVTTTSGLGGGCTAGSVAPGAAIWTFNPGNMDYNSSTPYVDFTNKAVWVTTRSGATAGTQPSVWKLNVQNGTLLSSWSFNHVDAAPSPSMDGNYIYIGSAAATPAVYAIKIADGSSASFSSLAQTTAAKAPYPLSFNSPSGVLYVPSSGITGTSSTGTCTATMTTPVTPGNTNVVVVATASNTATVSSVKDAVSGGSTYTRVAPTKDNGTTAHVEIWAGTVAPSGATATITVTLATSSVKSVCSVAQYSGVTAIGATTTTGSGSTGASLTLAMSGTNSWMVAGFAAAGTTSIVNLPPAIKRANTNTSGGGTNVGGSLLDSNAAIGGTQGNGSVTITGSSATWAGAAIELKGGGGLPDMIVVVQTTSFNVLAFNGSNFLLFTAAGTGTTFSAPIDTGGGNYWYMGKSDGTLQQWSFTQSGYSQGPSVTLTGSTTQVGEPAYDPVSNKIFVGAADGHIYAVTPF